MDEARADHVVRSDLPANPRPDRRDSSGLPSQAKDVHMSLRGERQ
jgi:hypothetical protein